MTKKLITLISSLFLFFFINSNSFATTYYVRPDGGTVTQCTGLVDAPLSTDKNCSFNHPFWAISPQGNNPTKLIGGDTLVIDGSYKIGFGAPNTIDTNKCSIFYPYDCTMRPIPSGIDALHPTRILGKGWNNGCTTKNQLWATAKLWQVLDLRGSSNVEVQCLDITDHSGCMFRGPSNTCSETSPWQDYGVNGIEAADSQNVLIKNVNIHGLVKGFHAGRLKNWTLDTVNIIDNTSAGWDGDVGTNNSSNSGTITFRNSKIQYSGCGETYPDLKPFSCYSQSQGGYGDGLGTQHTGGSWIFDGVDFSFNVSDGLDLLYHDGSATIVVKNSHFEGNGGNQVKINAPFTLDNTFVSGNCDYFAGKSFTSTLSPGFDSCRALGDTITAGFRTGTKTSITNTTVKAVRHVGLLSEGDGCNGTELLGVDNATTWELLPRYFSPTEMSVKYYAGGNNGDGAGTCGGLKITTISSTPPTCTPILNSCNALIPACGQNTTGVDNCGTTCTKTGETCACVSDGLCNAPTPSCGQTTTGTDNCGTVCNKPVETCPPSITYITISAFENWLTTTTIKQADTATVSKYIRIGTGSTSNPYKYYKITIDPVQ